MKRVLVIPAAALCIVASSCNHQANDPQVVRQLFVHKYGVRVAKDDWQSRGGNGQIISTFRDGTKLTENYSGGVLNGISSYTYPHSEIISKTEEYQNGELIRQVQHYSSGIPQHETAYLEDNQVKMTSWYEDGGLKSIEVSRLSRLVSAEYFTPSHELEAKIVDGEGIKVERDANGLLQSRSSIHLGETLEKTTFFQNGDPQTTSHFENGQLHGLRHLYRMGGEPHELQEWKNGLQDGITLTFHNGLKRTEVLYIGGKKEGVERVFDDRGELVEEISWAAGKRHGLSRFWVDGIARNEWYLDNAPVTQSEFESPRHLH